MAEISIKSFYVRPDESVEIRRFALSREEAKNFNLIREKLAAIYHGSLTKEEMSVSWKDEEGDEVSISSDDELSFALSSQTSDVFKINIRKIKPNSSSSPRSKCHHPGVVCDCCNKEIYGFRYKCMECPNYDLCSGCENAGNHSEHSMMRIVSPGARFPHHGFRPRPHYRPHKWNKFNETGACGDGPSAGAKRPCDSRRARFGGEPFHPYNLINRMWTALGAQMPSAQQSEKQTEEGATASGEQKQKDSATQADQKQAQDDFLRNIGETVAAVLDPLGIDVQVHVENGGFRTVTVKPGKKAENETKASEDVEMNEEMKPDAETGVTEPGAEAQSKSEKKEQVPTMDDGEWTCLDHDVEESMRNLPELLSEFHVESDEQDREPIHLDPHVVESVQNMLSMGFDNTSGWLTSIVTLCQGDVSRVIDLLAELGESNGPSRAFIEAFVALLGRHDGDAGKAVAIMRSIHGK